MKRFGLVVLVVLMVFVVFGCGKKSGLEGKVVDGKGAPVANVKIIAKQVQPIKGYEQFEATTGSDGKFSFGKLFPTSEYILLPWYEDWEEAPMRTLKYETNKLVARFNKEGWTTEQKMKVQSGPEGQTTMLTSPMVIQPCISTVTGKLVDGRKRPMQGIKIIAKQVQPIKDYEQFEATTSVDGSFSFTKLYPNSKYRFIPGWDFKTDRTWTVRTKGVQEVCQASPSFQFILANGVVSDLRTGLQWAAKDNGSDINWQDARSYCQNYSGGGHTDWRLPTISELRGLYKAGIRCNSGDIINITACCPWASKTRGSEATAFHFRNGTPNWTRRWFGFHPRVLPVRSGKFNDIHEQAQSLINQPLSYLEILELQKSDLEKVSDLFNVKGWNINEGKNYTLFTHGTNDNYHFGYNFNYGYGYDLYDIIYTMKRWSNAKGEQIELLQKSGHSNVMIYYTSSSQFDKLESEVKKNYRLFATKSKDDGNRKSFYRNGNMEIQFEKNIWISTDGSNETINITHIVIFLNISDINQIKAELCSNCKGKGYIYKMTEDHKQIKETCPICNGSGKNK